jgi:hypothetical protein
MTDANLALMTSIRTKWGGTIAEACKSSTVPESFLAALTANESGGNPDAKRFEHGVLTSLWDVLAGRKAAYGSLGRSDIVNFIATQPVGPALVAAPGSTSIITRAVQRLDGLATSWGLTQVMGYEAIVFSIDTSDLLVPLSGLRVSLRMISQFATVRDLDVTKNFDELFDCWNTGRPHSPTADPQYIPNGLARMQLYESLLHPDTGAVSA